MKEVNDELKDGENGSTDPKAQGASDGTEQASKALKNHKIDLYVFHNPTHRGMLDGLDEVKGGIVDLEGNHVGLPSSYIGKSSSQLLREV